MSTNLRCEFTTNGVWVYFRDNRARLFLKGSRVYEQLMAGEQLGNLESQQRTHATGTHEAVVGYRNVLTGEWSIPPDPSIVPAEASDPQYERRELRTLADTDMAAREMRSALAHKFRDDGDFTHGMDQQLGDPIQQLREQMARTHSNLERDTIRELIVDLKREAHDRTQVSTETYFHYREFDR